jgi:hypothetical protein
MINEELNDGRMPFRSGPHQSGLRLGILLRIDARPVIEQDTNGVDVAGACRHH